MCSPLDPTKCLTDAVGSVAETAGASAVQAAGAAFSEGFWTLFVEYIITPWTKISSPQLIRSCGDAPEYNSVAAGSDLYGTCEEIATTGPMWELREHLTWLTLFVMVLMFFVTAIRMVWNQSGQPAKELLKAILVTLFVSTAGVMLIDILMTFGDVFTDNIITSAVNSGFADKMTSATSTGNLATGVGIGAITLIVGLLGIVFSVIQIILLLMRIGVVMVMAAVLPLAAASSAGPWGASWFAKMVGWTFAFILFKPVSAIFYAAAIYMIGASEGDAMNMLAGVTMTLTAIVTLPAMIALLVPHMSALNGGGGGGMGMAAGAAIASGARHGGGGGGGSASGAASGAAAGASKGAMAGPKGAAVGAAAGAATSAVKGTSR